MIDTKKIVTVGVDVGGSRIGVGIFDALQSVPVLIDSIDAAVDSSKNQQEILSAWENIFLQLKSKYIIQKVGVAFPAPFDYENGVCLIEQQDKFRSLFGLNLKKEFGRFLGLEEQDICFLNDAEAYLRGEVVGSNLDFDTALLLTLGTGLGSAWKLSEVVKDAGLWSSPFKDSIIESYVGTAWFVRRAREKYGVAVPHVRALFENLAYQRIAFQLFDEFAANLTEFIGLQWRMQPFEALVLGGNIAKAHAWFIPALQRNLIDADIYLTIIISELGGLAPLYGAASFAGLNPTKL
ncbi:MAG: ROK family protein [Mongoliitalea sp.]